MGQQRYTPEFKDEAVKLFRDRLKWDFLGKACASLALLAFVAGFGVLGTTVVSFTADHQEATRGHQADAK